MSAGDLPARPSLDSLRKQAKKLARTKSLSLRDAQLAIARDYGFAGWTDLTAEVRKRLGRTLEGPAAEAKAAIHREDHERLRALLAEYPALVTWRDKSGGTLISSTGPYALDCSDPEREKIYTRPVAAEILLDAGATVEPSMWEYLISTGSSGMLHLLARKQVLPLTLPVLAALGLDADKAGGPLEINRALMNACRFKHTGIALRLLDRAIALDPDLGRRIDSWQSRQAFVEFLIAHSGSLEHRPWEAFVIRQLTHAHDTNDLPAFRRWLEDEPWVVQPAFVQAQVGLIERAAYSKNRERIIQALLDRKPALLTMTPPPRSSALVWALDYGNAHLIPLLTRVWPLPDDLPHAAGTGNFAAVAKWFDAAGEPVLGSLAQHHPGSDPNFKAVDLGWGPVTTQQVLDIALAWAVLNRHFEIASFLLARGADINTTWGTHEAASILHEAAIQGNEDAVRFLIEQGADLAITDHRYHSTAEGWARYGAGNEPMADLLKSAAGRR
jgi:hypothetical protein